MHTQVFNCIHNYQPLGVGKSDLNGDVTLLARLMNYTFLL